MPQCSTVGFTVKELPKKAHAVATPNYGYEKRQKELAKKRKKEDKLKRKAEGKPDDPEDDDGEVSEDGAENVEGAGQLPKSDAPAV